MDSVHIFNRRLWETYEEDFLLEEFLETKFQETHDTDFLEIKFGKERISRNGVDMGAPGAKGCLTLWGLAAEEELSMEEAELTVSDIQVLMSADTDFLYQHEGGSYFEVQDPDAYLVRAEDPGYTRDLIFENRVYKQPRVFSVGGDDAVMKGMVPRIHRLLDIHRANDSVISDLKVIVSPIMAIYCERGIIMTPETHSTVDVVNSVYHKHTLVDSDKVRLYSPCSKAQETSLETNPAIGKAKQLFELSQPLDVGWSIFNLVLRTFRFVTRMHKHLPRLKHGRIHPRVFLPTTLGGLGISPYGGDYSDAIAEISDLHVGLIHELLSGSKDARLFRALGSYSRDRHARGVKFDRSIVDDLIDNLAEDLHPMPLNFSSTLRSYDLDLEHLHGYRAKRAKLHAMGFVTDRDLKTTYSRSVVQTKALLGQEEETSWQTAGWNRREYKFQTSLQSLAAIYKDEGRDIQYTTSLRDIVTAQLNCLSLKELRGMVFEEETYYSREMWSYDQSDVDSTTVVRPVEDILDSLVKLELPVISNRGWFHKDSSQ